MADSFKDIPSLDYQPIEQEDVSKDQEITVSEVEDPSVLKLNRASTLIQDYEKTNVFLEFVTSLAREKIDFVAEVNIEHDPEVWMAMQRVFSNPNPRIEPAHYFEVFDTLQEIMKLEAVESDPGMDFEKELLKLIPKELLTIPEDDEDLNITEDLELAQQLESRISATDGMSEALRNEKARLKLKITKLEKQVEKLRLTDNNFSNKVQIIGIEKEIHKLTKKVKRIG